jgi:hypothetical protein
MDAEKHNDPDQKRDHDSAFSKSAAGFAVLLEHRAAASNEI